MPISDRLKGLLDWWELRIENEDTKENVERVNPTSDINTCVSMGNNDIGRGVNK